METKKIFLCRHGETEMNKQCVWSGRTDVELNENGILQAQKLGIKLSHYPVGAIYSSPLIRSEQTAKIAAEFLNLDVRIDTRLIEADYGEAEGLSFDEVERRWPQTKEYWQNPVLAHFDNRFPGGESLDETCSRALAALRDIVESCPDKIIVVVTHAGVICSLLSSMAILRPRIKNGNVIPIKYQDNRFFVAGKIF